MNGTEVRVLLLGENESGSSYLRAQLEKRGCRCYFARSSQDGLALYGQHSFDLILNTTLFRRFNAVDAELGNVHCTIFQCHPVEDGCWWLPVIRQGQKCIGAPGLRASEFLGVLDQILRPNRRECVAPSRPLAMPRQKPAA